MKFYEENHSITQVCLFSLKSKYQLYSQKKQVKKYSRSSPNLPEIRINNATIVYAEVLKNLGFIMNTKLSCTHHVNATDQKIYCVLRKLCFAAGFLQPDLKLKLIKSFIIPFITSIKKLQLAINYCARFISTFIGISTSIGILIIPSIY